MHCHEMSGVGKLSCPNFAVFGVHGAKAAVPGAIEDICDSDDEELLQTGALSVESDAQSRNQPFHYSWNTSFNGDLKNIIKRSLSNSLLNNEQFADEVLGDRDKTLLPFVQYMCGYYLYCPYDSLERTENFIRECLRTHCACLGIIRQENSHAFKETFISLLLDFVKKRCQENSNFARNHLVTHPDEEVFFCFQKCRSKSTVCVLEEWIRKKLYQHARSFKLNTNSQDLMMKNISKFLDCVTLVILLRVSMTTDEAGLRHYLVTHSPAQTPVNIIEKFILSISYEKGEGDEPCKWIYKQSDCILENESIFCF